MKRQAIIQILILAFTLAFPYLIAKANEPDSITSLKADLGRQSGIERMQTLEKLVTYYYDKQSKLAIGYATQLLKLAELSGMKSKEAGTCMLFSSIYKYQLHYEKCLEYDRQALKIYSQLGDSAMMSLLYYRISENFVSLSQFDSAIYYNDELNRRFASINDSSRLFQSKMLLGKAHCRNDKNAEALAYFVDAWAIADELNKANFLGWVYYWLGYTEMKLGNFTDAKKHLQLSMEKTLEDNSYYGWIGAAQELGDLYLKTGEWAEAYKLYFEAWQNLDYVKGDVGTQNFLSQHCMNLANIYLNIGNYGQALNFLDSAETIATKNKFEGKIAFINQLRGNVLFKDGKYDKALAACELSLDYLLSKDFKYQRSELYNRMGRIYEMNQNCTEAFLYYEQALDINIEIDNKFGIAQNYVNLASCYYQKMQLAKMKACLDQGFVYAEDINVDRLLLKYYIQYINFCERSESHQLAHSYIGLYVPLSEKYNNNGRNNLAALLIEIHQNEQKKTQQMYQQEVELMETKAERNQYYFSLIILLAAFILLALGAIAYLIINKRYVTKKLERQVNERTKELRENEKKLIDINDTRDRFYSIIAHDLKSPFNSLIGFANLLNDDYDDFTNADQRKFIRIIRNSSEEIFALLENLLDWTRKSSENIKHYPVKIDLQQIIRQAIQLQEKNAQSKNINIQNLIPKNTFVFADENMLRTIIRNLTSNALKFTNAKGAVSYEAKKVDGFIECKIVDTGIGISEKMMSNLFDLKAKIKKKGTANESGTGLGLLLCKDFVERNGGQLTVESAEGKGSVFTFTLPAK